MRRRRLLADARGATAIEFALAAPVMIAMVIGVFQLGQLFFANAGIQHTVEQAARFAAVYPAPSTDAIEEKLHEGRIGLRGTIEPVLTVGKDAGNRDVLDISLSYAVPLDFIFFQTPPVTLTHSRRVYLREEESSGGSTSASTSAGGTSSAGTTTSSTSTGSTTTSSTGGSTTTSSTGGSNNSNGGGNGNNGNSNGNSNGGR